MARRGCFVPYRGNAIGRREAAIGAGSSVSPVR